MPTRRAEPTTNLQTSEPPDQKPAQPHDRDRRIAGAVTHRHHGAMISEEPLRARLASSHLPSRKALPPFEALRAFDAIARLGGVRKAAQYLCRDHAVVSRHLRAIEDWTGTKLIERTPGGAVLTADGVRYHREVAVAMDLIANATIDLIRRGDNRCLHIRCMPGFALHWLSGRLGD